MASQGVADNFSISLASLPATAGQRRFVLAVAAVLLAGLAFIAPFASIQLIPIPAFIPVLETAIFLNDLTTSTLLFTQYSIVRSRAVLALAAGYLFTALIIVPHLLTYPRVFSASGLLGAGLQTTAWLYYVWHAVLPAAVICYVFFKDTDRVDAKKMTSARTAIYSTIAVLVVLVCGLTWFATAGDRLLPEIIIASDTIHANRTNVVIITSAVLLITVLAAGLLWARRRTVLDYWLLLMLLAGFSEMMLTSLLVSGRWALGFYAGRGFALITSMVVLVLLLGEFTRLYARLAQSNMILHRERSNKLMNVEVTTAAIAHEINQPLAAMVLNAEASFELLEQSPPDLPGAKEALKDIIADGHRTGDALDGVRALFRKINQERQRVDINEIALNVLHALRGELNDYSVTAETEFASGMPLVDGNRGQLQQVIFNLVHNAVEAMGGTVGRIRMLRLITRRQDDGTVVVAVQDTGPGIVPELLDRVFEAFVTTKSHGTGLGLAICRTIVERHGGQLTAWSDGKTGALFQMVLPIKRAPDANATE